MVLVGPGRGVGEGVSKLVDAVLEYSGKSAEVTFSSNEGR